MWIEIGIPYLLFGALFAITEHLAYDWDFENMSKKGLILNILQQIVHYTRCILLWPLYLIEDLLIYVDNREE